MFQQFYRERNTEIESYFAGEIDDTKPLQIGASWHDTYKGPNKLRRLFWFSSDDKRDDKSEDKRRSWPIMLWPWVWLPHAVVFLAGSILFILYLAGCINFQRVI